MNILAVGLVMDRLPQGKGSFLACEQMWVHGIHRHVMHQQHRTGS